jgi:hypothetical protein
MKKFGIGCLAVIGAIVVLGVIGSAIGGNKNQTATDQSSTTQKVKTTEEVMKISARELVDDFEENQVAAENKWSGKLVEFSAKITNITDYGLSFMNVGSKDFSFAQISCRVKDKNQLLPLKKEQTVTVRGTVGKQTIGVIDVSDCEVVQ